MPIAIKEPELQTLLSKTVETLIALAYQKGRTTSTRIKKEMFIKRIKEVIGKRKAIHEIKLLRGIDRIMRPTRRGINRRLIEQNLIRIIRADSHQPGINLLRLQKRPLKRGPLKPDLLQGQ
jgi:hypothetical protein